MMPSPEEQTSADDPDNAQGIAHRGSGRDALCQCHERQNAALATVVGPHHQDDVFDCDHQHQSPENQRKDPEHLGGSDGHVLEKFQAGFERIERAGADVAVDDTQNAQERASR